MGDHPTAPISPTDAPAQLRLASDQLRHSANAMLARYAHTPNEPSKAHFPGEAEARHGSADFLLALASSLEQQIPSPDQRRPALALAALERGITVHQQYDPPRPLFIPIFRHPGGYDDLRRMVGKGIDSTEKLGRTNPIDALVAAAEVLELAPIGAGAPEAMEQTIWQVLCDEGVEQQDYEQMLDEGHHGAYRTALAKKIAVALARAESPLVAYSAFESLYITSVLNFGRAIDACLKPPTPERRD